MFSSFCFRALPFPCLPSTPQGQNWEEKATLESRRKCPASVCGCYWLICGRFDDAAVGWLGSEEDIGWETRVANTVVGLVKETCKIKAFRPVPTRVLDCAVPSAQP